MHSGRWKDWQKRGRWSEFKEKGIVFIMAGTTYFWNRQIVFLGCRTIHVDTVNILDEYDLEDDI